MEIPPGFITANNCKKVCKLRKALYGLKQSPREWFKKFTAVIVSYGFVQAHSDNALFIRGLGTNVLTVLSVYVDDIILTENDNQGINDIKLQLATVFELKDLGPIKYFLGMEVGRNKNGISISQRKYVIDLLSEAGILGCKPVSTPVDSCGKLKTENNEVVDKLSYQRLVGKLIYLSQTRPDICYAVSYVSQFMHNPTSHHFTSAMRILRYLKNAPGQGLYFRKTTDRGLNVFTDADWGSSSDLRSTSRYGTFLWGNGIARNSLLSHEAVLKLSYVLWL